jgi:TatD DNase family protein
VIEEDTEFVSRGEAFDDAYYDALAASPKVIAVGETGLDRFHVPKDEKTEDVMDTQKRIFLQHYRLAQKHNLPLVIHVRDAHNDMIELLKTLDAPIKGVIHCYTGNWTYAKEYLDLGLYLGFTGVITFPPKKTDPQHQIDLLNVLEHIPLDRMVVETDSPYLAPQAYRGKRAEPWMVEETVKKIAEIRGMKESDLAGHVAKNTKQLFQKMK